MKRSIWRVLLVAALALSASACGSVNATPGGSPDPATGVDAPVGSTACVLDTSKLDNCTV